MNDQTTRAEEGARAEAIALLDKFNTLTMDDAVRAALGAELRARAAEASASALRDRVAVLESALKPFAKAGELFDGLQARDNGQEYSLCSGNDLRAARAALKESTHV